MVSQHFVTTSTQAGGDASYAAGYNAGALISLPVEQSATPHQERSQGCAEGERSLSEAQTAHLGFANFPFS